MSLRLQALQNIADKHATNQKLTNLAFENAMEYDDIKKAYNAIRATQYEIAHSNYLKKDVSKLNAQFAEQRSVLNTLLNNHGIDPDKLKTKYNCQKCHDKGTINGTDCECLQREINEILLNNSGIDKDNLPDFDDVYFKIFGDNQKQVEKIYKVFREYCDKLKSTTKKVVTISGSVGVGKTYLMECVVNECIKNNYYVIYTTAFNLNNDMLKYHTSSMDAKSDILSKYINCDLLCIDDLGTEPILRNVTNEYLYLILNERLQKGKNTIITTNLALDQIIDTYDERIFSRIANQNSCLLINMTGEDLRLKTNK